MKAATANTSGPGGAAGRKATAPPDEAEGGERLMKIFQPNVCNEFADAAARRVAAMVLFDGYTKQCLMMNMTREINKTNCSPQQLQQLRRSLPYSSSALDTLLHDLHVFHKEFFPNDVLAPEGALALVNYVANWSYAPLPPLPNRNDALMARNQHQVNTSSVDRKPKRPADPTRDYGVTPRTPILFKDLRLFSWAAGRYIDGEVTAWVFTGSSNAVMEVRGVDGAQFGVFVTFQAANSFVSPMGYKVRVLDPYLRADTSGGRTIRVDSGADIQVTAPVRAAPTLQAGKASGDQHLQREAPAEALRAYTRALRGEHGTPPVPEVLVLRDLFNNMTQMLLDLNRHREALFAAAAVRFLDPENQKAAIRYSKALEQVKNDGVDCIFLPNGKMPHFLFSSSDEENAAANSNDASNAATTPLQWKERGNSASKEGSPARAVDCYLRGLRHPSLTLFGNLFSNATRAASEIMFNHVVLITAPLAAFLNPSLANKNAMFYALALQHLGFTTLSSALIGQVCSAADSSSFMPSDFLPRLQQAAAETNGIFDFKSFVCGSREPVCEFVHPSIAVKAIRGKGRGIVATQGIRRGELLMASCALALVESRGEPSAITKRYDGGHLVVTQLNYGRLALDAGTDIAIINQLQSRAALPGGGALLHDLYALKNYDDETLRTDVVDFAAHKSSWQSAPFLEPHNNLGFDLGRVIEAASVNSFNLTRTKRWGLFFGPSFFNSCCTRAPANTIRREVGPQHYFFFSTVDIAAGTELTVRSVPLSSYFRASERTLRPADVLQPPATQESIRIFEELLSPSKNSKLTVAKVTQYFDTMYAENIHAEGKAAILELIIAELWRSAPISSNADRFVSSPVVLKWLQFLEREKLTIQTLTVEASKICCVVMSTDLKEEEATRSEAHRLLQEQVRVFCFGSLDKELIARVAKAETAPAMPSSK